MSFAFVKGHGTRNDFLVLPDLDGAVHRDLNPGTVVALCDRRAGIGADGVLRVVRGDLAGDMHGHVAGGAEWFMDYRNADGSVSEMCGNGVRVFARYLVHAGLVNLDALEGPLRVGTRDGVKLVTFCDDGEISVDMGVPVVGGPVKVTVEGRVYDAVAVETGNPHAVTFVESLDEVGSLAEQPGYDAEDFPEGVNLEFVVRRGAGEVAMRVHERGVGETWSCGTGACAVAAATAWSGRGAAGPDLPATYTVRVPGGTLTVTWDADRHLHLKGPAELVAEGTWRS